MNDLGPSVPPSRCGTFMEKTGVIDRG